MWCRLLMISWTFVTLDDCLASYELPVFGELPTLWTLLPQSRKSWGKGQELMLLTFLVTGVQTWTGLHLARGRPCMDSIHSGEIDSGDQGALGSPYPLGSTHWQRVVPARFSWSGSQCNGPFFSLFDYPAWFSRPSEDSVNQCLHLTIKFLFHLN